MTTISTNLSQMSFQSEKGQIVVSCYGPESACECRFLSPDGTIRGLWYLTTVKALSELVERYL